MRLFLDTSALVALSERRDPLRERAACFIRTASPPCRFVTSNLVFVEAATLIAARWGQDAAVRFGESFLASRMVENVHYADEALEWATLAVMRRFRDKDLSFTDASTIALVRAEGLDGVFGFDEDFARCGVPLFPR